MPNAVRIAILAVGVLAQLAVPVMMIQGKEAVLREGRPFKFRTAPVDPADVFRGRYVALRFDWQTVPLVDNATYDYGEKLFGLLDEDEEGFAKITALTPVEPEDPHTAYIPVTVSYTNFDDRTVVLDFPFDRYYMEESIAPEAERAYFSNPNQWNGETTTYALVRVLGGDSVIEDIFIENTPIREYVLQQAAAAQ